VSTIQYKLTPCLHAPSFIPHVKVCVSKMVNGKYHVLPLLCFPKHSDTCTCARPFFSKTHYCSRHVAVGPPARYLDRIKKSCEQIHEELKIIIVEIMLLDHFCTFQSHKKAAQPDICSACCSPVYPMRTADAPRIKCPSTRPSSSPSFYSSTIKIMWLLAMSLAASEN
jgi:hypothetical protein